jgi:hypothetical protein
MRQFIPHCHVDGCGLNPIRQKVDGWRYANDNFEIEECDLIEFEHPHTRARISTIMENVQKNWDFKASVIITDKGITW